MISPSLTDDALRDPSAGPDDGAPATGPRAPRPTVERIGLAIIAVVVIGVFGALAAASFVSGELFLALMAGLGALMTAWAGGRTLLRG
jgi:hypothetical protein